MSTTLKFGAGNWAYKDGKILSYNDQNNNFKPLPFDFTRASSATRVNKAGLIEEVGQGVPRIDYTNDANGALLLEPSRTNYCTQSENFNNSWTRSSIDTPTIESITAPDGVDSVRRLKTNNADGSIAFTYHTGFTQTSGVEYTITVYAKSYDGTNQEFGMFGNGSGAAIGHTGTLIATDEWQRFTYTYTASNTSTIGISKGLNNIAFDILFWGFQIEAGSYATSYIPTNGSTVTRVAETCADAGNSQVFNDSEGTLFYDLDFGENYTASRYISLNDGSNNNRIQIGRGGGVGSLSYFVTVGGSTILGVVLSEGTGQNLKLAIRYKANDYSVYSNGVEIYSNTSLSSTPTSLSNLEFSTASGGEFFGKVKESKYYNTGLSNAELAALTS